MLHKKKNSFSLKPHFTVWHSILEEMNSVLSVCLSKKKKKRSIFKKIHPHLEYLESEIQESSTVNNLEDLKFWFIVVESC